MPGRAARSHHDDVLTAGSVALARFSGYASRDAACAKLESQLERQAHAHPEWEAVYRRKAYGASAMSMRAWLERYGDAVHTQ
jgi:hypothetical protein